VTSGFPAEPVSGTGPVDGAAAPEAEAGPLVSEVTSESGFRRASREADAGTGLGPAVPVATTEPGLGPAVWEANSEWWTRTFTEGADPEYERQILPLIDQHLAGATRVLDLGCGEGQVARRAVRRGAVAAGIDGSPSQLARAAERGGGVGYVRGVCETLPYRDGTFDAVVCCLVIEHVFEPDTVFAEVARVLSPAGRFLLIVNHPLFQGTGSGLIDDHILGERYWRVGPYLLDEVIIEEVDLGVRIPFSHRPLSGYLNPLADLGLYLTKMEEPGPLPEFLRGSVDAEVEGLIPRLLLLRLERR
jgi:SAM-dependent methyltransferase